MSDEGAEEQPPQPARDVLVGTGMPASILLDQFGQWLYDAFGETAYHVGSSMYGKQWRDVDVRLMLDDQEFFALFPGYRFYSQNDAKWALINAAISELGRKITGLPIDFQIQRAGEANVRYDGARNPLALYDKSSADREVQRAHERAEAARREAPGQ